jgi:hypothetical protein
VQVLRPRQAVHIWVDWRYCLTFVPQRTVEVASADQRHSALLPFAPDFCVPWATFFKHFTQQGPLPSVVSPQNG